ncbi:MAG: hypothetical protein CMC75_07990 [Flavobacteriaceae bacterium]|nr:hypothetical protein [Flavobacteriaceae bacterium]
MMKKALFLLFIVPVLASGQVGINTTNPHPSSILDMNSTTSGVLVPRMTAAEKLAITTPATGLLVYQTDAPIGFFYYDGTSWVQISTGSSAMGEFQSISGLVQNTTAVGSDDFVFGDTDLEGAGSKFFLDTSKGAFRAGQVFGNEWDDFNVGIGSVVLGYGIASGPGAIALGENAVARGAGSTAISYGNAEGSVSFAGVYGNASGDSSIALNGSASGEGAVSIAGTAVGQNSMAFMGGTANAAATRGVAIGVNASSEATDAFAIGNTTEASGSGAFAIGNNARGSGDNSIALGTNISADSYAETVIGYNSTSYAPSSTTTAIGTDRLFVVANNSTNNALNILKNGRMGISRLPNTNILEVEGEASKTSAGDWLANSDARLKKNIVTFSEEKALEKLLALRGVTYEWNDNQTGSQRPEGTQYGFIAQEIQEVFPENVEKDNLGFYQTAYGTYDALYVQSIKALHQKIETLEQENTDLKNKIDEIHAMLTKNQSNYNK